MAFLGWFVHYFVIALILAAIAGLGLFAGKKLRERKDAKTAVENEAAK
ncbi:MAG: vanadium nitrogenase [Clostridiales bacterium]|mgnify:CR=1 FL=1|nr:vanadium nitrogenase [Clostridiales bacterium]